MATVYLAQDLKHDRQVAVKVLRPDLAAALGADRFLREIKIAAQLHHPHILPLYDSGEADDFLYYVMPYIEGESLREKLAREGELPIAEAVKILREVADALASAHKHGVVHRDIKPDNIMLSENHALVQNLDFAETFLELAGVEIPGQMQGRSLVPLLKGQTPEDWRDGIYYQYYEYPGVHSVRRHYGVRTDRYKLIHYYNLGAWELFDLETDPDELQSVYDDPAYADAVATLKQKLADLRAQYQVPEEDPVPYDQ